MIIEKIQKNKIYLSTEEIMDVTPSIIRKYKLKENLNIESLYDNISYEASFEKGVFLISLKDRTKKELILKLKEKYENFGMIEKAVLKLEEMGYVDDLTYAMSYIRNKKYGKQKMTYLLIQKGVSREIIEKAYFFIDENKEEHDEKNIEEQKLEKLIFRNLKKDDKKLIQYLMRQGFELEKILNKIKEYRKSDNF